MSNEAKPPDDREQTAFSWKHDKTTPPEVYQNSRNPPTQKQRNHVIPIHPRLIEKKRKRKNRHETLGRGKIGGFFF